MPWARIPCDRLATIGLFGYELEHEDGRTLWYRGPEDKIYAVDRHAPRFWFESAGDAMQAGCTAIRISSVEESEDVRKMHDQLEAEAAAARNQDSDQSGADTDQ